MSAFIIGQMQIYSRDWMADYFEAIPQVVKDHDGQFLVRGGDPTRLEGSEQLPDAAFIIAFSDRAHANDFWNSDAFRSLRSCVDQDRP